ncbi:MAG TPA: hypothetical protein VID48_01660 [Solirubrobacteraceae bacterium]|jgi:hypothetical protein
MATRSIVTSQPDVACDVCARRLLRGEQPEVFLAGAGRRTVCDLCAPRATHEGWLRESAGQALSHRAPRGRRGRTLLDRLRQLREPARSPGGSRHAQGTGEEQPEPEPFQFLEAPPLGASTNQASFLTESFGELGDLSAPPHGDDLQYTPPPDHDQRLLLAIDTFNISEHKRRVAGVTRSLGTPTVNVRRADDPDSRILITVAWELCWYRYAVEPHDPTGVSVLAQGMELEELPAQELEPNATVGEHGELVALAA